MDQRVRQALRRILDEYTTSVCFEHRRFENLMRDLCTQHPREVSILSRALSERVAADLLMWQDSVPREVMLSRLARRLENNLALTEAAARWAVECWAAELLGEKDSSPRGRWYQFSGARGSTELPAFALDGGVAIFETTHQGTDNLLVDLRDQAGRHRGLVANVIGNSCVTKPVGIQEAGEFYLGVRAGGKWGIEVRQTPAPAARMKPVTFAGSGQQATPFIQLEKGATHFRATHQGRSNFIVTLLSGGGGFVDLMANQIGPCQTSKDIQLKLAGSYLLDVSGDGEWEIVLQ